MTIEMVYNAPYLINEEDIKIGVNNQEEALLGQIRHREIIQGIYRVKRLAAGYFKNREVTAIADYKDHILGNALLTIIKNMSCRDSNQKELTKHAYRYWRYYNKKDIIPEIELSKNIKEREIYKPDYLIAGHLGSLGYYVIKDNINTKGSWEDVIRNILISFWRTLGIEYEGINSRDRHRKILEKIGIDKENREYINKLEKAILLMYEKGNKNFRRYAINTEELIHLPERLILGEFKDIIIDEIVGLQAISNIREEARVNFGLPIKSEYTIKNIVKRTLRIGYSGGMALVYQAFILEGYYEILKTLTEIIKSIGNISIKELIESKQKEEEREKIAKMYALIADGNNCLHYLETIEETAKASKVYRDASLGWLATTKNSEIDIKDGCRLGDFIGV